MRVAILISGSGSNMEALVRDMARGHPARPVLVLSNVEGVAGLTKAEALGVPRRVISHGAFAERSAFDDAIGAALTDAKADLVCLAGFMRVLGPTLVRQFRMLNIHPSLLPRHKGLHTHRRVLESGDDEHGCTVHEVTPALDDGPVLGQARIDVRPDDTPDTLAARVQAREHVLYPAVLRRVAMGNWATLHL